MYDKGKVLFGLAIFVIAAFSIVAYNQSPFGDNKAPNPEKPKGYTACVKATDYMESSHMVILNEWRDEVIREGKRETLTTAEGITVEKSLQNGCMKCHTSKAKFCDRCHTYANVAPYCWDCHLPPVEADASKEVH